MKTPKKIPFDKGDYLFMAISLFSIGLLYFFPQSIVVKIILILVSFLIGFASKTWRLSSAKKLTESENIFFLKSRSLGIGRVVVIILLLASFAEFHQSPIGFLQLMIAISLFISTILEFFHQTEYPKEYIYLDKDALKNEVSGKAIVNLKKLKYVKLNNEHLILQEKWAHHKIVFAEFEEGDRLKEVLLEKITTLEIEVK